MAKNRVVCVMIAWVVLGSCAVTNPSVRTSTDADASLVVGYIDMSDAPFDLGCVRITQGERAGIAYRQSCMKTLSSGLFFVENVPPMKYHIPFFYAGGKLHMISAERQDVFDLPPHSVLFLGAFKYQPIAPNLAQALEITPKQYRLDPVTKPSEAAVLQMLLENVEDDRWKKRIRARLAQARHRP
jgi:hypothetical protein